MKKINKKSFLLFALIAVILMAGIGGTLAYLTTKTTEVENVFKPSQVTCEVDETFNGTTKTAWIKNTGDVDAYIRAAVVANWVDDAGNIVEPATVSFTERNGWTGPDTNGFYYYNSSVASKDSTGNLFDSYTPDNSPKAGLHLQMTILAQAIQADGNTGATATNWSGIKNPGSTEN